MLLSGASHDLPRRRISLGLMSASMLCAIELTLLSCNRRMFMLNVYVLRSVSKLDETRGKVRTYEVFLGDAVVWSWTSRFRC